VLQQYLEQNDERKAEFDTWTLYRRVCEIDRQKHLPLLPLLHPQVHHQAAAAAANTKPRRPKSELDRAFQSHELALRPEKKFSDKGKARSQSKKKGCENQQYHGQ
jgi:hypothetical protein